MPILRLHDRALVDKYVDLVTHITVPCQVMLFYIFVYIYTLTLQTIVSLNMHCFSAPLQVLRSESVSGTLTDFLWVCHRS